MNPDGPSQNTASIWHDLIHQSTHLQLPLCPDHFFDLPQEVRKRSAAPLRAAAPGRGVTFDYTRMLVDNVVPALLPGWGSPIAPCGRIR